MNRGYDFIGDIHGKAEKLGRLLEALDYRVRNGAWRHPDGRQAVFVGDLIDRGPEQLATIEIVRRMRDAGDALCIMGNHEHNALGWVEPNPARAGEFFRLHRDYNRRQHEAFLAEVEHRPQLHADALAWIRTLPIVLELDGIRVAHACWDERHVPMIVSRAQPDGSLSAEALTESLTHGTPLFKACEVVMKGPEARLPDGGSYVDAMGKRRHEVRVAWWKPGLSVRAVALPMPGISADELPDAPLDPSTLPVIGQSHLHFFGHYWMSGTPHVLAPNLVSVDFHGTEGYPLTAYRWSGETELDDSKFVQMP